MTNEITKSDDTKNKYRHTFMQLYNRACKAHQNRRIDPATFVQWLDQLRPSLAKRTWWSYKAACMFALEERQLSSTQDIRSAITQLRDMTAKPCQTKSRRTSAAKAKRLTQQDLLILCSDLMQRDGVWGARAADWLMAGHATGLRPVEWSSCRWVDIDDVRALQVTNAKATNGRSHGEYRHLLMPDWNDEVIALIDRHITALQQFHARGQYYTYYDNCRTILHRAARFCFPTRKQFPTLYSARHQFAADMKREFPANFAAALMGHSNDNTVRRQYAQARIGVIRDPQHNSSALPSLPQVLNTELARIDTSNDVQSMLAHLNDIKHASAAISLADVPKATDD